MSDEHPSPELDFLGLGATIRGFVPGQRLHDRYVLKLVLDWSNRGVGWLAFDDHLRSKVEIRFLPESMRLDAVSFEEIRGEVRRSKDLIHPNIARVYDFFGDDTFAAFSMEYVDGDTLFAWRESQPTRVFEVAHLHEWTMQLLDALDYAHVEANFVHGDLNPYTLLGDESGELKVLDFGTARAISDALLRGNGSGLSGDRVVYMSPQLVAGGDLTVSDDIYAFGATLYALLTGKPPFLDDGDDVLEQIQSEVPPSMARRLRELGIRAEPIPDEWERTIAACLLKEPAARPQSLAEVAEGLGYNVSPITVTAAEPTPTPMVKPDLPPASLPPALPLPRAKRWGKDQLLILCLVVLFVLDGLGFYIFKFGPDAQRLQQSELAQRVAAAEAEKKKADEIATVNEEEKAILVKANQEAEARAAAAEQAARQAQAEAEKANQSAPEEAPTSVSPVVGRPWINSLGVKFMPAGTEGVLFSVWDVRVKDYAAFATATGRDRPKPNFDQTENDPVVMVSWDDARAFCDWLTKKEQAEGRLSAIQAYRLPTDVEWSKAVGLKEPDASTPRDRNGDVRDVFPWGVQWGPPTGAGNYAELLTHDGFVNTSPVGSFKPNAYGLYDMGGNVWQWCEDKVDYEHNWRVLRGASWGDHDEETLFSSCRSGAEPDARDGSSGFRVVLVVAP